MANFLRILYAISTSLIAVALCIIAYKSIGSSLTPMIGDAAPRVDYTNMVVILLTTVTVIFSVCALALAVLGVIGFRSLKREAGRYASLQALAAISSAFEDGGDARKQIEEEFTKDDGHLKRWAHRRIRQEVITLLPLVVNRLPQGRDDLGVDEDAPTDEGDVD